MGEFPIVFKRQQAWDKTNLEKNMDKVSKKSTRIETFAVVNENAAGIDISDREHVVAVCPRLCHQNVRSFASFTDDLKQIVRWLKECSVTSVAMESTGVYWVQLFLLLQQEGFQVYLVNAKHVKNVTGRKSDESDAAWIQKLHSCGLLNSSFQPDELTRSLRSSVRHRKSLIRDSCKYLNRLQKALELMNIKVHTVISDIGGKTGQDIIGAIIAGERQADKLAQLADCRIKASKEIMIKALEGYWREEHLFELKQCYEMYGILKDKIAECDLLIQQQIQRITASQNQGVLPEIDPNTKRKRSGKNQPSFNLTAQLVALYSIDITQILGISELSALEILAECGTDMKRWPTYKHFVSWLGLCPNTKISGAKVISSRILKKKQSAGQAFRMAASTLYNSKTPLGDFFRRIRARQGAGKAVVATARKIAVIYYQMIAHKANFDPDALQRAKEKYKERKIKQLEAQLIKLKAA